MSRPEQMLSLLKWWIYISAFSLSALASPFPASAEATPPPPILHGIHRLMTMGASITQYAARPGGYVWLMQRYLDALYPDSHIQVIDVGVSGNTSGDMVRRFKRDVIDRHADLVTIKEGFNDVSHRFSGHPQGDGPGCTAEEYGQNMATMVGMAKKAGIRVLIMTPTIYEDDPDSVFNHVLKDYAVPIRKIAQDENVPLADQYTALLKAWQEQREGKHERLTTDRVHLTLLGDAVLARTTLLAMGIPADQLTAAEPAVRDELKKAVGVEGKE